MIGRKLGQYRIVARIGAGGMGVVYRAYDERLEREVALKVLQAGALADETAHRRFHQEALALSRLNHPHICTIYEAGEVDGQTYIAMELVEGRPLQSLAREKGLPVETAIRCGVQIAGALAHAHERGILHRDLKNQNVMMTPDGRAKVLDFGLAKRAPGKEGDSTLTEGLTAAGMVVGTLQYMPPEVLRGDPADARSELWSLGVMLFEMVSGHLPFAGKTSFETSSKILRESPPALSAQVPAGLRGIIERCLAKQPGERYQAAGELRAALETLQPSVTKAPAPVVPPDVDVSRRRRLWVLGAVAGVATLAVVAGVMVIDRRRAPAGASLSTGGTASKNSEANEYFEKAILFNRVQHDLSRARLMLERALQLDPSFAEARGWYGFSHVLMIGGGHSNDMIWLYKAEEELRRAQRDNPASGRVHSALAAVYLYQGRKELVPIEVGKALSAKPDDSEALYWLLLYHRFNGENAAAMALAKRMIEREPLYFAPRMYLGEMLREQGEIAGAIREQEKILEQAPDNLYGIWFMSRAYMHAGELIKARGILQRGRFVAPRNYLLRMAWALLLALEENREEALKEMDDAELKFAAANVLNTTAAAEFYALLGETSKALEWLDRAVRNGDDRAEWFRSDPMLASIRKEPRFQQILDSITYRQKQRLKQ